MKKTLRFSTALKKSEPTRFATMAKPIGSRCNLLCNYCYYIDKELQYQTPPKLMSDEVLEAYIRGYIEGCDAEVITFCWHGGEPLMAGLEFYRKVIELQRKYAKNKRIENTLQTNGVLLNDSWARFFADNSFLIGISIDGPKSVHDANRLTRFEEPTFDKVIEGLECLKRAGVEFNTLSAVSSASAGHGVEIYNFLKSLGSHYMQFLPVSEHTKVVEGYSRSVICAPDDEQGQMAEWSISARDYGCFLIEIFDEWVRLDVGTYYVQIFDATLARWCGVAPGVCSMGENCGDGMVVEYNGDVYSCDHFVYDHHKLGNVLNDDLRSLYHSARHFEFAATKYSSLPAKCTKCLWLNLCNGECPKHRFGDKSNSLCSGLQHFFRHTAKAMEFMRECIERELPPSLIMHNP